MFRSPILPASISTSATNSERNAISSELSGAALERLLPGVRIPKHQSNKKNMTTASPICSALPIGRRIINVPSLRAASESGGAPPHSITQATGLGAESRPRLGDGSALPLSKARSVIWCHHNRGRDQPIFFLNRSAQKQKSATAMTDRMARFGQYSKK